MDAPDQENYHVPIKGFIAKKQTSLFNIFKQHHFTGEVILVAPNSSQWRFYLSMGRLVCATGGEHSVRRWRRHLAVYLPQIAQDTAYLEQEISSISSAKVKFCWEHELLIKWILEQRAERNAVIKMTTSIATEIFFDLHQCAEVTFYLDGKVPVPMEQQICLFDAQELIMSGWKQWQKWLQVSADDCSPNKSPIILEHQQLQEILTPKTYNLFVQFFNGRNTLRDLAIKLKKDIYQLTSYLLPYIQQGQIQLVSVADLPAPVSEVKKMIPVPGEAPLIVCIDDSVMICETMKTLSMQAGFRFLGITQPLQAMSKLLSFQPDIIFLDLMMSNSNASGYEICSQLRKSPTLKETPIILLSANHGMIEKMRSKMIGASDFLLKPIDPDQVLAIINKYLFIT